jgi:glycosyltransferase involved in cell wall biosynthesis
MLVENMSVPRDRRVWQEARALRDLGMRVSVISPRAPGDSAFEQLEGIEIHRHELPQGARGPLGYLREYATALLAQHRLAQRVQRRAPIDYVHICNPPDLLYLIARRLRSAHGAAIVFDHHDLAPELFVAKFGRTGVLHRALLAAERATFRAADVVISPNESYRDIALQRGGVAPERVFVVRGAPDLRLFENARADRGYRGDRELLVGYVGVLGDQDGVDVLLRVMRRLVDDHFGRRVHLMIIGDGPASATLLRLAGDLGIGSQVEFTGWQSGEALVDRLAECDVCVVPDPPNAFTDRSSMIKLLEYMTLGKPTVQFETTEGRRSADDASLYATPGDEQDFAAKVALLLSDPEMRSRMGMLGRERIRSELAWHHQLRPLESAYARAREARLARRTANG